MRITCVGYRDWALSIYSQLKKNTDNDFLVISSKKEYDEDVINEFKPDIILFYGWSWKIGSDVVEKYNCIMLHPAPLPRYRGGSPLQNQIINGEKSSSVTIFKMDEGLDTGPIISQKEFNLDGELSDIFARITRIGYDLTLIFLKNGYTLTPQDNEEATYFERRNPSDSEISLNEIRTKSRDYLHNKIRMLQDPYPNAYIRDSKGKKLYITKSYISKD